jgi:hypothetical protein
MNVQKKAERDNHMSFQMLHKTISRVNGHHNSPQHIQLKIHFGKLSSLLKVNDQDCASSKTSTAPCECIWWKFPYHHICLRGNKKMITREMGAERWHSKVLLQLAEEKAEKVHNLQAM